MSTIFPISGGNITCPPQTGATVYQLKARPKGTTDPYGDVGSGFQPSNIFAVPSWMDENEEYDGELKYQRTGGDEPPPIYGTIKKQIT